MLPDSISAPSARLVASCPPLPCTSISQIDAYRIVESSIPPIPAMPPQAQTTYPLDPRARDLKPPISSRTMTSLRSGRPSKRARYAGSC
ncbi:hypothetical protein IQ07DRAFT_590869 [Pyrenochaeta sp. DS3sAY3a]|nr:hypothetical protein IQ07DRAFT_590869 [Pyrenochaeta sp. DS3sAY3a]